MESFRSYLPSYSFGLILGSLVLVGGLISLAYFWPAEKSRAINNLESPGTSTLSAVVTATIGLDSDGDGLKDWEESLWGTDPKKADSDGDGTLDGEEVKEGRNPAVKGPGDKIEGKIEDILKSNAASAPQEPLGATDIVARDFFVRYMIAQQAGEGFAGQEQGEAIIADVLANPGLSPKFKTYSERDLIIVADSKESWVAYGNALGKAMKDNPAPYPENEFYILKRALEREDQKELQKLEAFVATYQEMTKDFLGVNVPRKFVPSHIVTLNSLQEISEIITITTNVYKDPILALIAVSKYQGAVERLAGAFNQVQKILLEDKISFSESDHGFYFLSTKSE